MKSSYFDRHFSIVFSISLFLHDPTRDSLHVSNVFVPLAIVFNKHEGWWLAESRANLHSLSRVDVRFRSAALILPRMLCFDSGRFYGKWKQTQNRLWSISLCLNRPIPTIPREPIRFQIDRRPIRIISHPKKHIEQFAYKKKKTTIKSIKQKQVKNFPKFSNGKKKNLTKLKRN